MGYPTAYPTAPPPPLPRKPASVIRRFGGVIVLVVIVVGFFALRQYLPNDAGSLQVGDCFDRPKAQTDIKSVQNHPCSESHDAEVIAVIEHPDAGGAPYPVAGTLSKFADDRCVPAFKTYTNVDFATQEELDMGFFYPTSAGWSSGDRTLTCYLYRVDEQKLTGSKKAAAQ